LYLLCQWGLSDQWDRWDLCQEDLFDPLRLSGRSTRLCPLAQSTLWGLLRQSTLWGLLSPFDRSFLWDL
jgi:hypothetical protein